jgi:hypothetical protein
VIALEHLSIAITKGRNEKDSQSEKLIFKFPFLA